MRRSVSVVATLACVTLAGCAGSVSDGSNGSEDDSAFTVAEPVAARQSMARLVPGGTVDVDVLASAPAKTAARDPLFLARLHSLAEKITEQRPNVPAASNPPSGAATATPMKLDAPERGLFGFEGLKAVDNDTTGEGGAITPPDQAMCAGNGWVLEGTNSSMHVYNIIGQPIGGPISANDFFGIPVPQPTDTKIEFASDPKCYFDKQTNRFFATTLDIVATTDTDLRMGSPFSLPQNCGVAVTHARFGAQAETHDYVIWINGDVNQSERQCLVPPEASCPLIHRGCS